MRHYLSYILTLATAMTALSTCSDDDAVQPVHKPAGLPGDTLQQTIIIYMAGENSLAEFVSIDSMEIAAAMPDMDENCRVVVFIDDDKSSRLCAGTRTTELQTELTYHDNICATDSAAMGSVLDYIFTTYPAEHYGLILWSHASGWIFQNTSDKVKRKYFGIDNGRRSGSLNTGLRMDIPVLANVLGHCPHLDYIFFDACFMQCVEVAYELRYVADYIGGSPAEIPGDGAPYQLLLPALSNSTVPVDRRIADALQAYSDFYTSGDGYDVYHGVELSIIDTSRLGELLACSLPFLRQMLANRGRPTTEDVQAYCPTSSSSYYTEFIDMQHLFRNYINDDAAYSSWLQAFEAAVPVRLLTDQWFTLIGHPHFETLRDKDNTGGVSVFIPSEYYSNLGWTDSYKQLMWARDTGFDQTGW